MTDMRKLLELFENKKPVIENPEVFDSFDIELSEHFVIETGIIGLRNDGVIVEADDQLLALLEVHDILLESEEATDTLTEGATVKYYVTVGKPGIEVIEIDALGPYDAKVQAEEQGYKVLSVSDSLDEAKYQGREVPLGKPMKGDVAKSKVYVRKPNGKIVKVNFGDKNMRIKKSNPKRRKSFRARHRCENPGPRWKARYWSCRAW